MMKDLRERLWAAFSAGYRAPYAVLPRDGFRAWLATDDGLSALAALKAEMREDEKAMQEAVATYLGILHDGDPLGNRAKALRNRITTLACILFEETP